MARKQQSRSRSAARRASQPARPAPAPESRATTGETRPATTTRRTGTAASARGAVSRTGVLRAEGAPSATLLRNAEWERAHVVRDFRRIGAVVILMAVLLVVADILVNLLLK